MKKVLLLLVSCVVAFSLSSCGISSVEKNEPFYHIDANTVETIDVYRGSVPADTVRKNVTERNDIERLVLVINDIHIKKKAREKDLLVGGIGPVFEVNFTDGTSLVVKASDDLIFFIEGTYVMKNAIDADAVWDSLHYEEVEVGEKGLPKTSKIVP
ncbi:MAG: hypothetical protein ACI4TK_06900 [Agathobacter sp.]